jgi:hypothetical protein
MERVVGDPPKKRIGRTRMPHGEIIQFKRWNNNHMETKNKKIKYSYNTNII